MNAVVVKLKKKLHRLLKEVETTEKENYQNNRLSFLMQWKT